MNVAGTFGLVAGWGRYPIIIAEALRDRGHELCCVGLKDHADPRLKELSTSYTELGLGKIGTGIKYFRRHGVTQATMAGKLHKVLLFQRFAWIKHFPDWGCVRTFYPHWITMTKDRRDDSLLGSVVGAYARAGITFAPATDFAPELLVKAGQLSRRAPSRAQMKDIEFGWRLAKEMGRLDVGQSVVVKGQAVMAIEAIEGTDLCLRRAGELCPQGGFTIVKVAKPQQDMRFDVPTIGLGTVQSLVEAGGSVLAVEAGKTIIIDQQQVIEYADQHGVVLVALTDGHL